MDEEENPDGMGRLWVPDHRGEDYLTLLRRLHECLEPTTYLEIGCNKGNSLVLAQCASLAIDPSPQLQGEAIIDQKPLCAIYRMTSDVFFSRYDPKRILGGPIDLAFLESDS